MVKAAHQIDKCSICLEEKPLVHPGCRHQACPACWRKWLTTSSTCYFAFCQKTTSSQRFRKRIRYRPEARPPYEEFILCPRCTSPIPKPIVGRRYWLSPSQLALLALAIGLFGLMLMTWPLLTPVPAPTLWLYPNLLVAGCAALYKLADRGKWFSAPLPTVDQYCYNCNNALAVPTLQLGFFATRCHCCGWGVERTGGCEYLRCRCGKQFIDLFGK